MAKTLEQLVAYINSKPDERQLANEIIKFQQANPPGDAMVTVYSRKTTLTDAQIKALPTTPVQLVAAPGAGKVIKLLGGMFKIDTTNGVYTNDNSYSSTFFVSYESGGVQASNMIFLPEVNTNNIKISSLSQIVLPDGSDPTLFMVEQIYEASAIENKALTLQLNNTPGNLTGGDPANTITVTVFYSMVDL